MGEKGLRLRRWRGLAEREALQTMLAMLEFCEPGDQARISNVVIHDKSIIFEINAGRGKRRSGISASLSSVSGAKRRSSYRPGC